MAVTNCPGRRYRTQGADICTMQRQLFLFNDPRDEVQGWVLCTRITNYLPCLKTLLIWSLGSNKAWNSVRLNKKLWGWPVFGQLPPALFAVSSSLPEQREPSYSWQIAPHVGLSMKSLPVFSSSHISNAFFLKAIFLKKKIWNNTKNLQLTFKRKQRMFLNIWVFLSYSFFSLLSREKKLSGKFLHRDTGYNTPCWLHIKDTKY